MNQIGFNFTSLLSSFVSTLTPTLASPKEAFPSLASQRSVSSSVSSYEEPSNVSVGTLSNFISDHLVSEDAIIGDANIGDANQPSNIGATFLASTGANSLASSSLVTDSHSLNATSSLASFPSLDANLASVSKTISSSSSLASHQSISSERLSSVSGFVSNFFNESKYQLLAPFSSNQSTETPNLVYSSSHMLASDYLASDNLAPSNLLSSELNYMNATYYGSLFESNSSLNLSMNGSADYGLEEANVFILPWYQQAIWSLLFGSMVLIAAGGNAIVIWIVLTHERMRTVTNYFIVNLSVADIMVSTLNVIFNFVYMLDGHWPFGDAYCKISNFISILSVAASVFTLMAISLDR